MSINVLEKMVKELKNKINIDENSKEYKHYQEYRHNLLKIKIYQSLIDNYNELITKFPLDRRDIENAAIYLYALPQDIERNFNSYIQEIYEKEKEIIDNAKRHEFNRILEIYVDHDFKLH